MSGEGGLEGREKTPGTYIITGRPPEKSRPLSRTSKHLRKNLETLAAPVKINQGGLAWPTKVYTLSYLILFSMFGTLARLGLQALNKYDGAPVTFPSVWPNFAGCFLMGFLYEDRVLFRRECSTPTYDQDVQEGRSTETRRREQQIKLASRDCGFDGSEDGPRSSEKNHSPLHWPGHWLLRLVDVVLELHA